MHPPPLQALVALRALLGHSVQRVVGPGHFLGESGAGAQLVLVWEGRGEVGGVVAEVELA